MDGNDNSHKLKKSVIWIMVTLIFFFFKYLLINFLFYPKLKCKLRNYNSILFYDINLNPNYFIPIVLQSEMKLPSFTLEKLSFNLHVLILH